MLQKVMVVNDNELLLMIAKKMISISQFAQETITAADGLQALDYFDTLLEQEGRKIHEQPEFLFLDLHMPGMDGWEFLEVFTQNTKIFPQFKDCHTLRLCRNGRCIHVCQIPNGS